MVEPADVGELTHTVRLPRTLTSLPELSGTWSLVAARSYGTTIHLVQARNSYYVKSAPRQDAADMRFHASSEAERLAWLDAQGIPVPKVVEAGEDTDTMWLVTKAVEGVPVAGSWPPDQRRAVLDVFADVVKALHALPVNDCPFDRTVAGSVEWARTATRTGKVDVNDLDDLHRGWTAQRLLAELEATRVPDEDDLVVCHGDLCLDNVLIAPDTLALAGVLDVGRLGVADRWRDLSIILRNLRDECPEWMAEADRVERFLHRYGMDRVDETKSHFYWLLDEFF